MSSTRVDRDADPPDLAGRQRVVGVHAELGRQVERGRQARRAGREQVAEALVGLLGRREPGVLAHRPRPAAVHRGVDAPGVREGAGLAESLGQVETLDGGLVVDAIDRDPDSVVRVCSPPPVVLSFTCPLPGSRWRRGSRGARTRRRYHTPPGRNPRGAPYRTTYARRTTAFLPNFSRAVKRTFFRRVVPLEDDLAVHGLAGGRLDRAAAQDLPLDGGREDQPAALGADDDLADDDAPADVAGAQLREQLDPGRRLHVHAGGGQLLGDGGDPDRGRGGRARHRRAGRGDGDAAHRRRSGQEAGRRDAAPGRAPGDPARACW